MTLASRGCEKGQAHRSGRPVIRLPYWARFRATPGFRLESGGPGESVGSQGQFFCRERDGGLEGPARGLVVAGLLPTCAHQGRVDQQPRRPTRDQIELRVETQAGSRRFGDHRWLGKRSPCFERNEPEFGLPSQDRRGALPTVTVGFGGKGFLVFQPARFRSRSPLYRVRQTTGIKCSCSDWLPLASFTSLPSTATTVPLEFLNLTWDGIETHVGAGPKADTLSG